MGIFFWVREIRTATPPFEQKELRGITSSVSEVRADSRPAAVPGPLDGLARCYSNTQNGPTSYLARRQGGEAAISPAADVPTALSAEPPCE